jgi:hypothetical protein
MDNVDAMMIHQLMEEEAAATVDEDENMSVLMVTRV